LPSNLKPYFEESEQFLVYLVLQRRAHAMRRAFVDFQLRVLDDSWTRAWVQAISRLGIAFVTCQV